MAKPTKVKKLETVTPFHDDNYSVDMAEVVEWIGDGIDVLVTGSKEASLNGVYRLTATRATLEEEIEKCLADDGALSLDRDEQREVAARIASALRAKGVRL